MGRGSLLPTREDTGGVLGVSGGEPTHQRPLELTTKKKKVDVGSCHWPATPKCWSLDRYAVPPLGCGELRAFDYCAIHVIGIAHVSRKFHSRDLSRVGSS